MAEPTATEPTATEPTATEPTAIAPEPMPTHPNGDTFPLWPTLDVPAAPIGDSPSSQGATVRPEEPWPSAEMRIGLSRSPRPTPSKVRIRPKAPRRLSTALTGLFLLALLAGFVGWVSAEPFWLALGHGSRGTATVTTCTGGGLTIRCRGTFSAANGGFSAERVTLTALPRGAQQAGASAPATMVSATGRIAYAGSRGGLHLRWVIGLLLVVLCGLGIAWATGASRLPDRRARVMATLASIGAPLVLSVGILVATW